MDDEIVFSINDYGVLELYPWPLALVFAAIASALYSPKIRSIWPISIFVLLKGKPLASAIGFSMFGAAIFVSHLAIATASLKSDQAALRKSQYSVVNVCGPIKHPEASGIAERQFEAVSVRLDDVVYDPPGGIHGVSIIGDLKTALGKSVSYKLHVHKNSILRVLKPSVENQTTC